MSLKKIRLAGSAVFRDVKNGMDRVKLLVLKESRN